MKDIINNDGTFERYYSKGNKILEKGKYIDLEYDGEILNFSYDGNILFKRYFNKGILEKVIRFKNEKELILNNEYILENLFVLRSQAKNKNLRAFPSSIFNELNYIPTYYKNEDFIGELLLKIWGDNCLWLFFLLDNRKIIKVLVYRNKNELYSPKKMDFDFSSKELWGGKFKIKVSQAKTNTKHMLKPIYIEEVEMLEK